MNTTYDAIIIGGGHNGLVAAAMLALWVPARCATRIDPALVLRDG